MIGYPTTPPPSAAWTDEQKARYCGFVSADGSRVDMAAFRRAIEAPWRQA